MKNKEQLQQILGNEGFKPNKDDFEKYYKCHGVSFLDYKKAITKDYVNELCSPKTNIYEITDIATLEGIYEKVSQLQEDKEDNHRQASCGIRKYINYIKLNTLTDDEKDLFTQASAIVNSASCDVLWDDTAPNFDKMFAEEGIASIKQTFSGKGKGAKEALKSKVIGNWDKIHNALGVLNESLTKEDIENAQKAYNKIVELSEDHPVIHRLIAGRIPEYFTDAIGDSYMKYICESLGIDTDFLKKSDKGWFQLSLDLYHKFYKAFHRTLNDPSSYRSIGWNLYLLAKKKENDRKDLPKLRYKKAMVLYGPPGTGKTYEAMNMAKVLIRTIYAEKNQSVPSDLHDNIFHLQLHINYNYEDFVAGMQIKDGKTIVQEGFIFNVIKKANDLKKEDKDLPVVVILDEINRTDISRVFGELFSAIEKRGTDIDLTLKDENGKYLKLNIPDNVYFIGTMNEIDFSLERIDFALRRRFVWVLKSYDSYALKTILEEKLSNSNITFDIDGYVNKCTQINKKIEEEIGKDYYVGHAFFSEIADIINELSLKEKDALNLLWDISINPTLEAYCGAMDDNRKTIFLDSCKKVFLTKVGDNNGKPENKDEQQSSNEEPEETA